MLFGQCDLRLRWQDPLWVWYHLVEVLHHSCAATAWWALLDNFQLACDGMCGVVREHFCLLSLVWPGHWYGAGYFFLPGMQHFSHWCHQHTVCFLRTSLLWSLGLEDGLVCAATLCRCVNQRCHRVEIWNARFLQPTAWCEQGVYAWLVNQRRLGALLEFDMLSLQNIRFHPVKKNSVVKLDDVHFLRLWVFLV